MCRSRCTKFDGGSLCRFQNVLPLWGECAGDHYCISTEDLMLWLGMHSTLVSACASQVLPRSSSIHPSPLQIPSTRPSPFITRPVATGYRDQSRLSCAWVLEPHYGASLRSVSGWHCKNEVDEALQDPPGLRSRIGHRLCHSATRAHHGWFLYGSMLFREEQD